MDAKLLQEWDQVEAERNRRLGRSDPVLFAKAVGVVPDPWQEQVLRSSSRRLLLNCSRQSGKSTVMSIMGLHRAVYVPKSTVLFFSPSLRQSGELLRKVLDRISFLPIKPQLVGESKTIIELGNGSRIISLPATEGTIRTFTADLIVEDEAGDVEDALYNAILPMLIVSRGRLVLAGTPKGRRGHFFESWERGGAGWERVEIAAKDCRRIDAQELAHQKLVLRELFAQEYECQFISGGGGMVYGAFDEQKNLVDELPKSDAWRYMLGLDFGFSDATAFVILAYKPEDNTAYVASSFKESGLTPSQVGDKVVELDATFRFTKIVGDTGGLGKGYSEEMRKRFRVPVEPAEKTNKRGYIDLLNGDLAASKIKILRPSNAGLIQELVSLPWNSDRSKEHDGFDNHLCDAFLYIWRACTAYAAQPPKPKVAAPEQIRLQQEIQDFWARDEKSRQQQYDEIMGIGFPQP